MNKEKPISFTDEMFIAVDEDRKTHTRRIVNLPKIKDIKYVDEKTMTSKVLKFEGISDIYFNEYLNEWRTVNNFQGTLGGHSVVKPKYNIGDKLWIKQNFQIEIACPDGTVTGTRSDGSKFVNIELTNDEWSKFIKWKQPYAKKSKLFMFKSLAYKWIEVTNVRCEKLQDISEDECIKEGIKIVRDNSGLCGDDKYFDYKEPYSLPFDTARASFETLWNSIHNNWNDNPFVFVYEFKRVKP